MPRVAGTPAEVDAFAEKWREQRVAALSFLPLLQDQKEPTTLEEIAFTYFFLKAAPILHDQDMPKAIAALQEIEKNLNNRRLCLAELFPWASMQWHVEALGEWERHRGGDPSKATIVQDLNRIAALIKSPHTSSYVKAILTAEHERLERLYRRPRRDARCRDIYWGPKGTVRIKWRDPRKSPLDGRRYPPTWTELVRTAHQILTQHGGLRKTDATRLLHEVLSLVFPQWFGPRPEDSDDPRASFERLQALLKLK